MPGDATYFGSPEEFRAWLDAHHGEASELLVGFHKVGTRRPSMTWPQSVDEALSFGWIDGVRRNVDGERYTIRFTPRKRGSIWSAVNIRRVKELTELGRMRPAGLAAFERREESKSAIYSHEQRETPQFSAEQANAFRENKAAWAFFETQTPSYRRTATWWVISAKKPETRERRLGILIEDSEAKRIVSPFIPRKPKDSN